MQLNLHNPGQCTGSILSLHRERNHFMSMRKHAKVLQQEYSVKLVVLYITLAGFTVYGSVCFLSIIRLQCCLEIVFALLQ